MYGLCDPSHTIGRFSYDLDTFNGPRFCPGRMCTMHEIMTSRWPYTGQGVGLWSSRGLRLSSLIYQRDRYNVQ